MEKKVVIVEVKVGMVVIKTLKVESFPKISINLIVERL